MYCITMSHHVCNADPLYSQTPQPALPDHPPVSPFLDPRSPLTSRSPKEPYPSLQRVSGMTCHLNYAPFLYLYHHHSKSENIIFSTLLCLSPPSFPLESNLFKLSFPDSPDSISSPSHTKLHPP